jgi:hypothetical protein
LLSTILLTDLQTTHSTTKFIFINQIEQFLHDSISRRLQGIHADTRVTRRMPDQESYTYISHKKTSIPVSYWKSWHKTAELAPFTTANYRTLLDWVNSWSTLVFHDFPQLNIVKKMWYLAKEAKNAEYCVQEIHYNHNILEVIMI